MKDSLTEENKQYIQKLYKTGKPIRFIANELFISYPTAWFYTRGLEKGFKSLSEYQEHLAKRQGFKSLSEYQEHLAKRQGFKSLSEYQEHLAKERGFKSYSKYQEYTGNKRRKREPNKKLSSIIKNELENLGKNQKWLSEQLGTSKQTITNYVQGINFPDASKLRKLANILQIQYSTLESLLE